MVTAYLQKQVHIIIITQVESILGAVKYYTCNKKRSKANNKTGRAFSTSNMIFSLRFNKYCGFCAHLHYIHSVGRKKKKKRKSRSGGQIQNKKILLNFSWPVGA